MSVCKEAMRQERTESERCIQALREREDDEKKLN